LTRSLTIVGGGPAGLVAAIAARQAGFDVTVFEQAPNFARVGGAVGIQSNGLCVLRALGLLDRFQPYIEMTKVAGLEAPPGRRVSHVSFEELDLPFCGFAVALRYDLQGLLLEAALEHGADIRFGHKCIKVEGEPEDDATTIHFENGRVATTQLLFACDGIHSAVRDSLGWKIRKRAVNEAYLRIVAPRRHPELDRVGEFWAEDGTRAGAFPLPGERTYVFCSVPLGQWQDILRNRLDEWVRTWDSFGDPIAYLIRSVDDWKQAVYDELHDIRVDVWWDNGVFLVGDAAHAMTPNLGQGANSAIVDALVLVNLLVENELQAIAARKYEKLRKPFVTRIQDMAWLGGQMASWQSAPARMLRDVFFFLGARVGPIRKSTMKITAGYNAAEQQYLRRPLSAVTGA
jgi:2-polyprenyl-6-methoxyphenol hydroxylase-like FAD-dependent oxidoreductase